jgi:parallel beta-helix repeat protein
MNIISDNEYIGITIDTSSSNLVRENTISGSNYGIYITTTWWFPYSNYNVITRNIISNNNNEGIFIEWDHDYNEIYYNNFINNGNQASDYAINTWDDGSGKGNYWSDYTGSDTDSDGIGDTDLPHVGLDYYPIMEPWDAVDKTNEIIEEIECLGLPTGTENSLLSKLENAIKSINKENYKAATNQLKAFINEVEALQGKKLSDSEAEELISTAEAAQWLINNWY